MAGFKASSYVCPRCRLPSGKSSTRRTFTTSNIWRQLPEKPAIAPRAVIDIKHIRQNPDLYAKNCDNRNTRGQVEVPYRIIELFNEWQSLQNRARGIRERNNEVQRRMAHAVPGDVDQKRARDVLLQEAREIKKQLVETEASEEELQAQMNDLAIQLPNLTSEETPVGNEPRVVGYLNERPESTLGSPNDGSKSHVDIGTELQLLDFTASATTSGWGWYFLTNEAALLEQALVQYALTVALRRGWRVVAPPSIVYSHIASACGFRPRDQNDEQQIYTLARNVNDRRKPELCLAGTAEIPLAGMKANRTLEEQDLPLKTIGVSRCYRAEAGARGVDTKGLYRVHEFTKVEMFAWTIPDDARDPERSSSGSPVDSSSSQIFHEMMGIQSEILASLGLRCRILEMPSGDLGASATRKRDIEAFFPSRRDKNDGWGEVTSTSTCADYQSRRLSTRVRMKGSGPALAWPHTINGTAMAVPRVLAALLENGWDERERAVHIPQVLWPWMGGLEVIRTKRTG